jgi:hypothetical protein
VLDGGGAEAIEAGDVGGGAAALVEHEDAFALGVEVGGVEQVVAGGALVRVRVGADADEFRVALGADDVVGLLLIAVEAEEEIGRDLEAVAEVQQRGELQILRKARLYLIDGGGGEAGLAGEALLGQTMQLAEADEAAGQGQPKQSCSAGRCDCRRAVGRYFPQSNKPLTIIA